MDAADEILQRLDRSIQESRRARLALRKAILETSDP